MTLSSKSLFKSHLKDLEDNYYIWFQSQHSLLLMNYLYQELGSVYFRLLQKETSHNAPKDEEKQFSGHTLSFSP